LTLHSSFQRLEKTVRIGRGIAVLAMAAGFGGAAQAHHSFAMFDREKTVTISGTVKDFAWTSPHIFIELLVNSGRGEPVVWSIEGNSPSVLARGGWTSNSLRPGDKVSIAVHPSKNGQMHGLLADEREVLVNGQPAKGLQWLLPLGSE
jgi:hypothetical protein